MPYRAVAARTAALVAAVLMGACTGELVGPDPSGDPGPDAAAGGSFDAAEGPDQGADAAPASDPTCLPIGGANGSGRHNAGQSCLSCHTGNGAPLFTAGGTLYTDAAGTAPLPGATIVLRDGGGNEVHLITAQNGNFYTTQTLSFPYTVSASGCPDVTIMPTAVDATRASCNASGCHSAGNRIHLP